MSENVKLKTTPSKIDEKGDVWVLNFPRFGKEGTHFHTYGQLTPYFKGLTEGKLLGTKCVNPGCPIYKGKGELWVPPRKHCPDCHSDMAWEEIAYFQVGDNPGRKEPTTGEIHYQNVFRHIARKSTDLIIGMEHGKSKKGKEGEIKLIEAYVWADDFEL